MMNVYKAGFLSFMLPVILLLNPVFVPYTSLTYLYIALTIIGLTLLAYPILLIFFRGKKRRENAPRAIILINTNTFCLFFAIPLIKVYYEYIWLQLLLLIIFLISMLLPIYDQNSETPLVFPDNREQKRFALVYYLAPVLLMALAGGGNIIIVREMHLTFGDSLMSVYFSIISYLLGCWLVFLFNSLYYKGLVKDGRWVKRKKNSPKKKVPLRA